MRTALIASLEPKCARVGGQRVEIAPEAFKTSGGQVTVDYRHISCLGSTGLLLAAGAGEGGVSTCLQAVYDMNGGGHRLVNAFYQWPEILIGEDRGSPGRNADFDFALPLRSDQPSAAAYLMLADQSRVGALDLAALARGEPAEFREVPLGSPLDRPLGDGGLMTRLAPDPGVLAVHSSEAQGYRLNDYAAMGNAPASTAMPIRGGMPRLVATIDRSFAEGPRGTFRTVAVLPGPGHWELVATTGLGALSFCLPAPVADPGAPEPDLGRLVAVSVDEAGSLRLKVLDGAGAPATIAGTLMFAELTGAWRDSVPFRTGADGVSTDIYELPADADVAVTLQTPDGRPFHPLILETDP